MDYRVKIIETSRDFTTKERVQVKDTTDCVSLDKATKIEDVMIQVDAYAVLEVHNEKSDDKDYNNYVIIATDGTRYTTGSDSFWNAFCNIFDEMSDCNEPWMLKVYRKPSKNREGQTFITCSVV